jgi:hypothetical protein
MTLQDAEAKALPLLVKYGLHGWRISLENLRNERMYGPGADNLGYCDLKNKTIRIDGSSACHFRQTLLHEIAHALRGVSGHDMKWVEIADKLGCTFGHLLPYINLLSKSSAA